jgi:hypothetical protein
MTQAPTSQLKFNCHRIQLFTKTPSINNISEKFFLQFVWQQFAKLPIINSDFPSLVASSFVYFSAHARVNFKWRAKKTRLKIVLINSAGEFFKLRPCGGFLCRWRNFELGDYLFIKDSIMVRVKIHFWWFWGLKFIYLFFEILRRFN